MAGAAREQIGAERGLGLTGMAAAGSRASRRAQCATRDGRRACGVQDMRLQSLCPLAPTRSPRTSRDACCWRCSFMSRTGPVPFDPWRTRLQDIQSAIDLAELRCTPVDHLIAGLDVICDGDFPERLVDYLQKNPPDDPVAREAIADKLDGLLDAGGELRGKRARPFDRALYRLIRLAPPERARRLGAQLIRQPRKIRRQAGYRALHVSGVDRQLTESLLAVHAQHGDQEALVLLSRFPFHVATDECDDVLASLIKGALDRRPCFAGARIIEWLLSRDSARAIDLAAQFPPEAAWAIGRTRDPAWLPLLRSLYDAAHEDPAFVTFYVWAVGVLRSEADLERARRLVDVKKAGIAALLGQ